MEPENSVQILLKALPDDLLRIIVAKVASSSAVDYCSARLSCKSFMFDLNDSIIAKHLNLSPLVNNPKKAKNHISLIDSCVKVGNVDAHYIKGVIEFFDCRNKYLGLHHLEVACRGGHREGSYLFGVLMMCFGRLEKGITVVNKFTDKEGIIVLEACWENIQVSLRRFSLSMKKVYLKSYEKMKAPINCHPTEDNTVCSECFHFYLVSEFIEFVMGLNAVAPR